jgi:uncharacterized protein YwbE
MVLQELEQCWVDVWKFRGFAPLARDIGIGVVIEEKLDQRTMTMLNGIVERSLSRSAEARSVKWRKGRILSTQSLTCP